MLLGSNNDTFCGVLSMSLGFFMPIFEFLTFPIGEPSNERRFIDSEQSYR